MGVVVNVLGLVAWPPNPSLKRMVFNFDTMVEEKLHSRFEFGSALNIAAFANSEISEETLGGGGGAPAESKASNGDAGDDAGAGTTTPTAVSPEFYDYTLSGIVCHTGAFRCRPVNARILRRHPRLAS